MILRPYQERAIAAIRAAYKEHVLCIAPTGSGKSVIEAKLMELAAIKGNRSLFLCDREELIGNAVRELRALGVECGTIKAGHAERRDRPIQVASVQTLSRRVLPPADIVVCDEADLFVAPTFQALVELYPNAHRYGFTATGMRLDGRGLGAVFTKLIVAATAAELIAGGYLVEPRYFCAKPPDLSGVPKRGGDYEASSVAKRMSKIVGDAVTTWKRLADGRRTLGFATNRAHAQQLCRAFNDAGIPSEYVDAHTKRDARSEALEKLQDGRLIALWNVGLFGRGTNIPSLECVVDCAPTLSLAKFRQRVGRLTRPMPGKTAIYLDHGGSIIEHGPIRDEPEWSLSDRVRCTRPAPLQRCPECFLIIDPPSNVCTGCGNERVPIPEVPKHEVGNLEEWKPRPLTPSEQARVAAYIQMLTTCEDRGHKPGYAMFLYKTRFNAFPTKHIIEAARSCFTAGTRIRDPAGDPAGDRQPPGCAAVS